MPETYKGLWKPFKDHFKDLVALGSVAYKLGLTSTGKHDMFATLRPKNEWDVCAGDCILREAGGELREADVGRLGTDSGRRRAPRRSAVDGPPT